jgi:hypothetical protein
MKNFIGRTWAWHVRWIPPHPQNPGLLLAGIELGGIMYTNDGGRTWRDHPKGAVRGTHELAWRTSLFL